MAVAARAFGEGLACLRASSVRGYDNNLLGSVATLAGAVGDHRRAAVLFGAATGLGADLGIGLTMPDRAIYAAAEAASRAALGEAAFTEEWARAGLMREAAFVEAEAVLAGSTRRPGPRPHRSLRGRRQPTA